MVRRLVAFVVLLTVVLGLPAAGLAGPDSVLRRPPPDEVARWLLEGDAGELELATNTLHGAPKEYLAAVIRSLRARGGDPVLAEASAAEATQVLIEARVYAGRRGLAKRLLGEGRLRGTHLLAAPEAEALRKELRVQERAEVLQAPSILMEAGRWGTVKVTKPLSYVRSMRVADDGGSTIADPVVDIVEEGLVLEARPVLDADGRRITLSGALEQTAVERPIATQKVLFEDRVEAEVQVPIVQTNRFGLHLTVPDGASVACTGLAHPTGPERELLVLLRVCKVGAEETAPPPATAPGVLVVTLEVRLLRATPEALRRALVDRFPDAESPLIGLAPEDVVRLLGPGRRGAKGVEILSAPRLTTYDGQQANVSVLSQTSYVKDFTVEKGDGHTVLDPVIDTIQDGLVFDVTPTITADRTRIGLETETTWAVLTRPIADFTTTIEGQEVTIQIPELRVSRVRKAFDVRAGGYVLIGGFDEDADGRRTCVLLHTSVTDLDEEERRLLEEGEGADGVPSPR